MLGGRVKTLHPAVHAGKWLDIFNLKWSVVFDKLCSGLAKKFVGVFPYHLVANRISRNKEKADHSSKKKNTCEVMLVLSHVLLKFIIR